MKVFRGEALLDVIFAAASILLIFLLLLQPGAKNPNYYRQASLVMGCFGAEGGGTWDGRIQLYSRGSDEGADPKLLQQSLKPDFLRSVIRKDIENGAQLFRIALMFDFAGSICMEDVRARISDFSQLSDLKEFVFQVELVPCEDRSTCEGQIDLTRETQ